MKVPLKLKRAKHHATISIINHRLFICALLITLIFLGLFLHLFSLQIRHYQTYATLSDSNRIKLIALPPTRGQIFDRNGEVLATNRPIYNLELVKEDVNLKTLDTLLAEINQIIPLTEREVSSFKERFFKSKPQEATILKSELTQKEIATLSVNLYRLDGVYIEPEMLRLYPHGEFAVHAVGYVGRIDEKDLQEIDDNHQTKEYKGISHIGKRGSEKSFESLLRGDVGFEKVETNSSGRVVRVIEEDPPISGKDIYLTLDLRLQKIAEDALEDHNGAVVAIDPNNGEILAFVSKPTYDPNPFVKGISHKDYARLQSDFNTPFLNRVMQGRYPPGSVIKPQIGLAGLHHQVITAKSTVNCNGWFTIPGNTHRFRDMGVYGITDLKKAIRRSCDVYFYSLAYEMGITKLTDYMSHFYLGRPTGVDLLGESSGNLPTPAYKRRVFDEPWYAGDTVTAGIGQSFWLTTPLQLANMVAITAVRGEAYLPHILQSYKQGDHQRIYEPLTPIEPFEVNNPAYWDTVIEGMVEVVHGHLGTGRRLQEGINYKIAGKSGTAQVKTIPQGEQYNAELLKKIHRDHALFTAFAPADNPQIAVAVIVENGGSGSLVAGPVAKKVMHAWITNFTELEDTSPPLTASIPP